MSAWRRVALELLPTLKSEIESAHDVGMLWIDLTVQFRFAYDPPKRDDLIAGIYRFAKWCLDQAHGSDAEQSALVSFFEHLAYYATENESLRVEICKDVARYLTPEEFRGLSGIMQYLVNPDEFAMFVETYELQLAPNPGKRKSKQKLRQFQRKK